ncbi:osteopetrosis-associated transmembrane protein 1 isoform X2 [Oncorhynchus tshawytscha]|uniref:osteopetrosis-associated transmembrane protein 1 isoform X2 n=1 Tax=Oncorhynchus tshawytscha TaxID=74940 RepID=UPI000D0A479C|nr:osteopetrosis-associated transmembrane protein 1 isoform X2 [Oncorhynchus tshawytscha]
MYIFQVAALLIAFLYYGNAQTSTVAVNPTIELSADGLKQLAAIVAPVFHPSRGSYFSLNLFSGFPEDLEVSDYCVELLAIFGQRYSTYVTCLVSAARPVKVCQNCYGSYDNLMDIYTNISSDQMGPGNVSCRDSLLRSDRLMLVFLLYNNLEDIWTGSECNSCVSLGLHSLTNDTLYFMATLNQSLRCFEKFQQGNHSALCKECKATYRGLNELYSRMEKNRTLCIDIEDSRMFLSSPCPASCSFCPSSST